MNKGAKVGLVIALFVLLGVGGYYGYKMLYKPKEDEDEEEIIIPTSTGSGSGSGSGSGGGSSAPSELDTKAKITDFQNYVINTKKDSAILGSSGADGLWGKNSQKAWDKYSADYKNKGSGSGNTNTSNVKATASEIGQIQAFADKNDKTTTTYLKGTNQEFVKKWAKSIKDGNSAFVWANQVYRVKTGARVLDYNPLTTTFYANKSANALKSTPSKSASASPVTKNQNLGKGGGVAFADGYLYIFLKDKEKWIASIWVSQYKVAFTGETEFENFRGFTNDND